jgi:tRNA pseudouridine55 synthase
MARRRKGRPVDGIVLLNKPQGFSSNQALQKVRWLYQAQKAGHTGTLDPMATGVLPICLGEATKFSQYLLDSEKAYEATIELGVQTTTGDAEGEVLEVTDASAITEEKLLAAMAELTGFYDQTPPMYSALKVDGVPLYKLARQGITVERKARRIEIKAFDLLEFTQGKQAQAKVYVKCSKGTYIRTLAEDLAAKLGVGAHLSRLHRVQAGIFFAKDMQELDDLEAAKERNDINWLDRQLFQAEIAVNHLPLVEVSELEGYDVRLGRTVSAASVSFTGLARIKQGETFIGIGEVKEQQGAHILQPKRLIATPMNGQ